MSTRPAPTRFFADAMLGRLARWLRMLGYDTAYERIIPDGALIERVLTEERWLLTRDGHLAVRKALRGRHTLARSDHVAEQLRQLGRELHLDLCPERTRPGRCTECNEVLATIPPEEARQQVPPFVAGQHQAFSRCPRCGRVFWPGTHWERFVRRLEELRGSSGGSAHGN